MTCLRTYEAIYTLWSGREKTTVHHVIEGSRVTLCGQVIANLPVEETATGNYFTVTCAKCHTEFCRLLNHWPEDGDC